MADEDRQAYAEFRERLSKLETLVEKHDVAHADAADIPEFEAEFFSLARDLLLQAFDLPKGFTYEEAAGLIESSERSAPLRAAGTKVATILNGLEYAPDRSYRQIDDHLRQLNELTDLAEAEPRVKHKEARSVSGASKLGSALARATSVLWFPFRWAYLALRRKGHERKVGRDETYQIDEFLECGTAQLSKGRLEDAIKTYERLAAVYAKMPSALKAQVRDRVVAFHGSIVERYEALKADRNDAAARS